MINGLSNCNYDDHHHQLQPTGPRTRELKIIARGQFCSTIIWQPVNSLLLGGAGRLSMDCDLRGGEVGVGALSTMEVEDIILDVFWCDQPSSSRRSNCQPVTMWIVTNVWISLILLLASGWSWSVSECHVSAVAAVGPAHEYSTVFISLAAARMHALLALGPFATVRSPSAGPC